MKKSSVLTLAFFLMVAHFHAGAMEDVWRSPNINDNISILKHLYYGYFKPDASSFEYVIRRSPDGTSHIAVYLFLARETGRDLTHIVQLRNEGLSWEIIFNKFGVPTEKVFIALAKSPGPPYGKAYGYWKKSPHNVIPLSDEEFADWLNVKILSETLGISPDAVIAARSKKEQIPAIAGNHYRAKHSEGKPDKKEKPASPAGTKGRKK